jgi:hypothetical protein
MPRFGLFEGNRLEEGTVCEGDHMETYTKEGLVKIMRKAKSRMENDVEVATFKLKPGQNVREL